MCKVLVIEDDLNIRENIKEIFEMSDYEVVVSDNGKNGLEKALFEVPDVIICDIKLPLLDGFDVLQSIQKEEKTKNIPFIFLTACSDRSAYRRAMELGADDYIIKPFDSVELLNAVEGRLNKLQPITDESGILPKQLITSQSADLNKILQSIVAERSMLRYNKKEKIYREGNHAIGVYLVIEGKIKTYRTNEIGKCLAIDLLKAGDVFGYLALFEGGVYQENAVALENTTLAMISKTEFEHLLNEHKQLSQKFIQLLAKNIANREQRLICIAYNSLRKKVADALLYLHKCYMGNTNEKFSIQISRDHLASIAGTATESLVRTLSDFKKEKLIDIGKDGRITIINEHKIAQMLY